MLRGTSGFYPAQNCLFLIPLKNRKMSENKNIRIKDIAKMAGVSVGTVDRVIHGRGKVSEDAQKKVEEILSKTEYQPNLLARTLGSNKKLKIIALIPDPNQDEYWGLSNAGVQQAIEEWAQYGVEITPKYFDLYHNELFSRVVNQVLESKPDGLLTAPIFYRESQKLFEGLKQAGIPYVLFNTNISEASPLSFIGQDLYQSGRVAGELLDLGKKGAIKIAVLHIYEDVENSVHLKAKEIGLKDYFNEQGNADEVLSLDLSTPDELTLEKQILELLATDNLRGILVTTSKGAYITGSIMNKSGNHDIRLVCYDLLETNIDFLKNGTIDFLINQNPKRQAQLGITYLANFLLFGKKPPSEDLFPLEIITRQNLESYISSRIH